jgi:acyl carrier protein
MANTSDIAEKIVSALAEYLRRDKSTIQPEHHLQRDLGLDSMAVIELVYRIEDAFDIQIPDDDLPKLTTVEQVVNYIQARLSPA